MRSFRPKFALTACAAAVVLTLPSARADDEAVTTSAPLALMLAPALSSAHPGTGGSTLPVPLVLSGETLSPAEAPVLRMAEALDEARLAGAAPVIRSAVRAPETSHPPPGHTRSLRVPRVERAPTIDGKLDDAVWRSAALARDFWVSNQQRLPTESTEVLVMMDDEHIYFGFRNHDSQPQAIEATQARRDAGLGLDDQVIVQLDTYLNRRHISSYAVNPLGTQSDDIGTGRADNISWKGDWQAAAARDENGWTAEMAIPLRTLNYRGQDDAFGINFLRYLHRTGEWSQWADVTPQNKPEEMGRITGLVLPAQGKSTPWTVMPYVLGGHNIPDKRGEQHSWLAAAGADIRYEPRPNLTGVLSLNPDFSQVERQVTDINFSYTEKKRAEARPFFQEGADYFGSDNTFFYSNRVPDFNFGAKFFSQSGSYQVGALATRAPGARSDVALRVTREMDATNSASVMLVGTDREDMKNTLAVGQAAGRFASGLNYTLDAAASSTEKQAGDGSYLRSSLGWRGDRWSVGSTMDRVSRDFLPANGLLKADLPGTWGFSPFLSYLRETGEGPLRQLRGDVFWSRRDTDDSRAQTRNWYAGGSAELRQQVRAGLYLSNGHYLPLAGGQRGEWSTEANHDYYWTTSLEFNTRSSRLGYGAAYSSGFLGGGDYRYLAPYLWAKPNERIWLNVSSERLASFGSFAQTIVSAHWDVTRQDGLAARYITANGQRSQRLAYARQVRSGVNVFAVYDRIPNDAPKVSLKLVFTIP